MSLVTRSLRCATRLARLNPHSTYVPSPFLTRSVVAVAAVDGRLFPPTPPPHSLVFDAARKKQLLYRSKQRGWLELDLIMGTWAERHIPVLSDVELQQYEAIVRRENPDLMKWLIEKTPVPEDVLSPIMQRLIDYTHGEGKTWIRKKGNQQ